MHETRSRKESRREVNDQKMSKNKVTRPSVMVKEHVSAKWRTFTWPSEASKATRPSHATLTESTLTEGFPLSQTNVTRPSEKCAYPSETSKEGHSAKA